MRDCACENPRVSLFCFSICQRTTTRDDESRAELVEVLEYIMFRALSSVSRFPCFMVNVHAVDLLLRSGEARVSITLIYLSVYFLWSIVNPSTVACTILLQIYGPNFYRVQKPFIMVHKASVSRLGGAQIGGTANPYKCECYCSFLFLIYSSLFPLPQV